MIREIESSRQNVQVEEMLIELKKTCLPNQMFYIINASLNTFHQTSSQHEGQPSSLLNITFLERKSLCANTIGAITVSLISCRSDSKCVNRIIKSPLRSKWQPWKRRRKSFISNIKCCTPLITKSQRINKEDTPSC